MFSLLKLFSLTKCEKELKLILIAMETKNHFSEEMIELFASKL